MGATTHQTSGNALGKHRPAAPDQPGIARLLPEIQSLIEASRQHVVSTANLTLVWLYWNVGRVISQEIQQHAKRAEYGEGLLDALGARLTKQFGNGFSACSLWDMRRFFTEFEILPPVVAELGERKILPPAAAESSKSKIRSAAPGKSSTAIRQPLASKSSKRPIRQPLAAESEDRITIDFSKHFRLGWTHYRILLPLKAGLKRGFYFEQAARQRWSKRELQRQIDRALFERVALSRDTRALVRLEKKRGPVETVRYEDAFKDPSCSTFSASRARIPRRTLNPPFSPTFNSSSPNSAAISVSWPGSSPCELMTTTTGLTCCSTIAACAVSWPLI